MPDERGLPRFRKEDAGFRETLEEDINTVGNPRKGRQMKKHLHMPPPWHLGSTDEDRPDASDLQQLAEDVVQTPLSDLYELLRWKSRPARGAVISPWTPAAGPTDHKMHRAIPMTPGHARRRRPASEPCSQRRPNTNENQHRHETRDHKRSKTALTPKTDMVAARRGLMSAGAPRHGGGRSRKRVAPSRPPMWSPPAAHGPTFREGLATPTCRPFSSPVLASSACSQGGRASARAITPASAHANAAAAAAAVVRAVIPSDGKIPVSMAFRDGDDFWHLSSSLLLDSADSAALATPRLLGTADGGVCSQSPGPDRRVRSAGARSVRDAGHMRSRGEPRPRTTHDAKRLVELLRHKTSRDVELGVEESLRSGQQEGGQITEVATMGPRHLERLELQRQRQLEYCEKAKARIETHIKEIEEGLKSAEERAVEVLKALVTEQAEQQTSLGRGLETVARMYQKMLRAYCGLAMQRWRDFAAREREREQNIAATPIQRITRCFLARRVLERMRVRAKAAVTSVDGVSEATRRRWATTDRAARAIQRVYRGWLKEEKVMKPMRKEEDAARVIQRAYRCLLAKRDAWKIIGLMQRESQSALVIQSRYRAYRQQKEYAKLKCHQRHVAIENRLTGYERVVRTNFQLEGAASVIQRAWRRAPRRFRRVVYLVLARHKQAKSTVEGAVRMFLAKKLVARLRIRQREQRRHIQACLLFYMRLIMWAHRALEQEKKARHAAAALPPVIEVKRLEVAPARHPSIAPAAPSRRQRVTTGGKWRLPAFQKSWLKSKLMGKAPHTTLTVESSCTVGDEHKAERMRQAAVCIQRVWRVVAAMRRAALVRRERVRKVILIQRWHRRRSRTKRWHSTAGTAHQEYLSWLRVHRPRVMAATKMQKVWRGHKQRKSTTGYRGFMQELAVDIQRLTRGALARRHLTALRAKAAACAELAAAGRAMFISTIDAEEKRQVLSCSLQSDVRVMMELQRTFLFYTSTTGRFEIKKGDKFPIVLEGLRFTKFINSVPGLLTKEIHSRVVEGMFDQCRSGKPADYSVFIRTLRKVADARLTELKAYGRLMGSDARLLKLVMEVILAAPMVKKIIDKMDKDERFPARARSRLLRATITIQRVYRGRKGRLRAREQRCTVQQSRDESDKHSAATRIQTAWRAYHARRIACTLAVEVYQKCTDAVSGMPFYFNPRTGVSSWVKPTLFFGRDVPSPIEPPTPEREFSIQCGVCGAAAARKWCLECEEWYCATDFRKLHSRGKAASHASFPADVCVQCGMQVASRHCLNCKDQYCDTCLYAVHRRGHLQMHVFRELTKSCATCRKYMALRCCETCDLKLCRVCAVRDHQAYYGHVVKDLAYESSALRKHREELELDRAKRKADADYRKRQAALKEETRRRAAVTIQRVWRGYISRKPLWALLGSPAERAKNRLQDDITKRQVLYKLRDVFGVAPALKSDGHVDKVLKKFPVWLRPLVVDAVEGEWVAAVEMVMEQDEHLRKRKEGPGRNIRHTLRRLRDEALARMDEQATIIRCDSRLSLMEMQRAYMEAALRIAQQNLSRAPKSHKESHRRTVRDIKAQVVEHDKAKQAVEGVREAALAKQEAGRGPNRLKRKLQTYRMYGKKLDFTLNARQGKAVFKATSLAAQSLSIYERYRVIGSPPKRRMNCYIRDVKSREVGLHNTKGVEVLLYIDRDWVWDNAEALAVYRLPHTLPLTVLLNGLIYHLSRTPLYQWPLKRVIIFLHGLGTNLGSIASSLEEGSADAQRLNAVASFFFNLRDLGLRRRVRHVKLTSSPYGVKAAARDVGRLLGAQYQVVKALVDRVFKRMKDQKDEYAMWEMSDDKKGVGVLWQDRGEAVEDLTDICVDIDMPCSILREVLRRKARDVINARSGEAFLFMNKGNALPKYYEQKRRAREVILSRTGRVSRQLEYYLVITKDLEAPDVAEIPVLEESPAVKLGEDKESAQPGAPLEAEGPKAPQSDWDLFEPPQLW